MYIVWTKQDYADLWNRAECSDQEEVRAAILEADRVSEDIEVTLPVKFSVETKVKLEHPADPLTASPSRKRGKDKDKEEEKVETPESGPEENQDTGGPGNGPV